MKKKSIVIVLNDVTYDFHSIKLRSVHAPVMDLPVTKIEVAQPHGSIAVDNSDIRVVRINMLYYLISGYNKVALALASSIDTKPVIVSVKLMSKKYLDSTIVVPVETPTVNVQSLSQSELAEKFKDAGFRVS